MHSRADRYFRVLGQDYSSSDLLDLVGVASNDVDSAYFRIPPNTFSICWEIRTDFSSSQPVRFSGLIDPNYDPATLPVAVQLRYQYLDSSGNKMQVTGLVDCDIEVLEGALYWSYDFTPSSQSIEFIDLVVYWSDPVPGSYSLPRDQDFMGLDYSFVCKLTAVCWEMDDSTTSDKYQNGVINGLDDIEDSIDKGFDSIQGEISGGSGDVVDAVDGVKDSVDSVGDDIVQWGQNIVTGITNGVTNIQNTIVEQTEVLGNFILDGLKSLFIPSEGYFKDLFDDLNEFFSDVFGFLYFPIEHVISWFNRLLTLPENEPSIAIPELAYEDTVLIEAQTYTFDFLDDEPFSTVHDYYLLAMDAAMIMGFVHLLQRKYEEVMKN